jgi:TatD DNase family protein
VRVVGETGLDYFRTGPEGQPAQQDAFRWHIDLAKRLGKTLQIHDRDAHDDVLRILDEEGAPERTVLHCFSGDVGMAQRAVERGLCLSFAGTVTFSSAKGLRDALSVVPLDRVLVETDAPYLTPHPWRGAANAPYLVPVTVRAMAHVLGVAVPTLCQAIAANSERLYGPW